MKELKELISIVSPNKVKEIELLSNDEGNCSNIQELYQGIADGVFQDEEEAMRHFYDSGDRRKYFNRLKRQLKGRLINTLFIIDANQPRYNDIRRAYYLCHKDASAVKILLARGARQAAIKLAEKTLKRAQRFEFTDILLSLSKDLRAHYGSILGDKARFTQYNKMVHFYSEVFMAELKAEEYYTELAMTFTLSRASKAEFSEQAAAYAEELEEVIQKYHSYRLHLFAFTVMALRYELANDQENTIATCQRAMDYFEHKKHLASRQAMFTFSFRMLSAYILLRRLEEGEKVAERCLELVDEGLFNWYRVVEYQFILYLHSEQYQKAYKVYRLAVGHESFSKQYQSIQETWYIYEAYINYFISIGIIEGAGGQAGGKFRVSKFLNEVPTYSKDKRGRNISILILQVLFLLQQKQYGKIIDRMESLRTYTHRYLRRDDTFRSNCFIKMLMKLPAANFHKVATARKAKKYWDKLKSVSIAHNQSAELEAVPYERLWKFVLESLDNKIY